MRSSEIPPVVDVSGTYLQLEGWWMDSYSPHTPLPHTDPWEGLRLQSTAYNDGPTNGPGYYDPHDDLTTAETAPMPGFPDIGGTVNSSVSDTLTAHFVWSGPSAPPDPAKPVYFLINESVDVFASVSYGTSGLATGLSASATASIGSISAPAVADASAPWVTNSRTGKYLVMASPPDASHVVTVSIPASVTTMAGVSVSKGQWVCYHPGGWSYDLTNGETSVLSTAESHGAATPDSRWAAITSSIDPTYHKGVDVNGDNVQVANVYGPDGTMNADTVRPASGDTSHIDYGLWALGDWSADSSYVLHCSSQDPPGGSASGTTSEDIFTMDADPYETCILGMDYGDASTSEHAYGHLTDSVDGAEATTNYYVTFHPEFDEWQLTNHLDHPGDLFEADQTINPEWTYITVVDNNSPASPSVSLGMAYTDTITMSGTIGGQATLNAAAIAAFQANASVTIGHTCTGTITTSYQFAGAPWTKIKYYVAKTYTEKWGTCDVYGTDGYDATEDWYGVSATDPMVLSIHGEDVYDYTPH